MKLHLRDLEKRIGGDSQYRVSESNWITIKGVSVNHSSSCIT